MNEVPGVAYPPCERPMSPADAEHWERAWAWACALRDGVTEGATTTVVEPSRDPQLALWPHAAAVPIPF